VKVLKSHLLVSCLSGQLPVVGVLLDEPLLPQAVTTPAASRPQSTGLRNLAMIILPRKPSLGAVGSLVSLPNQLVGY
jgi:hypothetical protein